MAAQPDEYDELPEITEAMLEAADEYQGAKLVRKGRPPKAEVKCAVSVRLSPEVLDYFRSTGKGWQTRIDEVLRAYVSQHR